MASDDLRVFIKIPGLLPSEQALPALLCERGWQYKIHHA